MLYYDKVCDVVFVCLYRSIDNRFDDFGGGYYERCLDIDCGVFSYRGDYLWLYDCCFE